MKEPNTYYGKFPPFEDKNRRIKVLEWNYHTPTRGLSVSLVRYKFVPSKHIKVDTEIVYMIESKKFWNHVHSYKSTPLQKWWQKRNYLKFVLKGIRSQLGIILYYCPMCAEEASCFSAIYTNLKFALTVLDDNTALAETFLKNKPK